MNVQEWIEENYPDEGILLADGFDRAFLGVGRTFNGPAVAVYDKNIIITILHKDGMSVDKAYEYFDYNVAGAYVGERTPMFVEIKKASRRK